MYYSTIVTEIAITSYVEDIWLSVNYTINSKKLYMYVNLVNHCPIIVFLALRGLVFVVIVHKTIKAITPLNSSILYNMYLNLLAALYLHISYIHRFKHLIS